MENAKQTLASGLLDIGCIKFGSFRLKLHDKNPDAPLSPIYIDLRILRSFPLVFDSAIAVYKTLIAGLEYDLIADVPTAATPFAAVLCHLTQTPMISPRMDEKQHGMKRNVDGVYQQEQVALLIDDLITKAESKLKAISILSENGIAVTDVVVLVDREQGGADQLEAAGYRCHSAYRLMELLSFYVDGDHITRDDFDRTVSYLTATNP